MLAEVRALIEMLVLAEPGASLARKVVGSTRGG
jgi:hypothetical protein